MQTTLASGSGVANNKGGFFFQYWKCTFQMDKAISMI